MNYNKTIVPIYNNNGFDIYHYDELSSSADIVKQDFFKSIKYPFVVIANKQNKGRGRQGRVWQCFDGNLFMNIVIPTNGDSSKYSQLSFVMALVISDVVSNLISEKHSVKVKWPNDILVNNSKICGCLIELNDNQLSIGVGFNIKQSPQLSEYKTCSLMDLGVNVDKQEVIDLIIARFNEWYNSWQKQGFDSILDIWKSRAIGIGEIITINQHNNKIIGRFVDVDNYGGIILLTDKGKKNINAGEVWF
ncbi:MAG: biotin--[acetyl-CoA-carboxylase] ligase [Alphaproteobacteria bacterium]